MAIHQSLEFPQFLRGKVITASVLRRGTGNTAMLIYTDKGNLGAPSFKPSEKWVLDSYTFTVPTDINRVSLFLYPSTGNNAYYTDYMASQLELGPVSTLAHKDASGNWVLNDPMPDKGLELLKCQRYLKYVSDDPIGYGYIGARGDAAWLAVPLSVPMRTTPTLVTTGKKIAIRGNGIEKIVEMSEVRVDRLRDDKILLKIPMTGIPAYTSVIAISAEANYDLFFSAEL
jgi:hypothetical protein